MVINRMEKEKNKRKIYFKAEEKRRLLKTIIFSSQLSEFLRRKAAWRLSALSRQSSICRLKKRCIVSGRSRFILGKFSLSGLTLRKFASSGMLAGLRKSSW